MTSTTETPAVDRQASRASNSPIGPETTHILDRLPSYVILTDEDGHILYMNHLEPRALPKIAGRSMFEFLPEDQVETVRRALEKALRIGAPVTYEACLHKNLRKSGELAWFVTDLAPFDLPGGRRGAILVSREITAEREARQAYKRLAEAVECSGDSVLVLDPDGRIRYANPAFSTITGYGPEEALGRTAGFLNPEDPDTLRQVCLRVAATGEAWSGECRWKRRDGEIRTVTGSISPVVDGEGQVTSLVCVQRDVTETRALERSLGEARKLEAIGRLAAGIAHEINTPAQYARDNTTFLGEAFESILQLLRAYERIAEAARAGPVPPPLLEEAREAAEAAELDFLLEEVPQAVESAKEGLDRIAHIVRAMKDFSHPSQGQAQEHDLNAIVDASVTVARNEWKHHADVVLKLDPDLPRVRCIRDEIGQTFLNMVVNAAHAIEETGRRGTITIETIPEETHALVRISDTGAGIPKEALDKIFEPFFTTKEVGKGTGQGLALAHSVVVEKHGGAIEVESEVGGGTTFTLRLPYDAQGVEETK